MVDDESDKVIGQVSDFEETSFDDDDDDGILLKTCVDCGTTKTPLWRGGPSGPKSLCNACGIRSRKKRRAMIDINKEDKKPKKSIMTKHNNQQINNISIISSEETSSKYDEINLKKKKKLLDFGGKKVGYQRPRSSSIKQKKKQQLGEIEEAAFLLMALSCKNYLAFL